MRPAYCLRTSRAWEGEHAELVPGTQLAVTPLPQARLRDLCSCLPLPVRCRVEDTPKARARPTRTQSWTTLSGTAPVAGARVGKFSVTTHLGRRVATGQPRTFPVLGGNLQGYSMLSGIPGSYSSLGIHEPSSRLCCPGGSFVRSQSAGCVFVSRPNTARPDGGVLNHPPILVASVAVLAQAIQL